MATKKSCEYTPPARQLNQYGDRYLLDFVGLVNRNLGLEVDTVVEYGTGSSTMVLGDVLARRQGGGPVPAVLLSIDHNGEWQRQVASTLPYWSFLHLRTYDLFGSMEHEADVGFNYATAPYLLRRQVDLAYVDGRTRAQCVLAVAAILKDSGTIILDDGKRERYQFLDGYFDRVETQGRFKIFGKPKVAGRFRAGPRSHENLGILRVIQGRQAEAEAVATRSSVERYAYAIGAQLVDHIVADAETPTAVLKFMLRGELERFDRAVVLDSDVLIRAGAPSLFDLMPDTHLGVVREDRYLDRSEWLDCMVALYDVPREHGNAAPYFNSGVMVLSRRHYPLLSLPEAGILYAHPLFEQTYLNARVRSLGIPLYELPREFNYISDYDHPAPPDWRYGWLIHLAGSWEGPRRTQTCWRETATLGDVSIRRRQAIASRDTRVPRLRALAKALDLGERIIVLCAPDFVVLDERRVVFDPVHCSILIDLARLPAQRLLIWGPYVTLDAGSWAVAIQLRGAGAPKASLLIDCTEEAANRIICARARMMADDSGVIRFQIDLNHHAEQVEFRFWEAYSEPLFFEAIKLRRAADKSEPVQTEHDPS
jgi:Methyltransferase domain